MLRKINEKSASACSNSLNLFMVPPTNTSINRSMFKEFNSINASNESPAEFRILNDSQFMDPANVFLNLKMSIEKLSFNGTWIKIGENDKIGPIQSIGNSYVRQLRLSINGNDVYDSGILYAFQNYIKNELSYSSDYKKSTLEATGYRRDDDKINIATNSGHVARMKMAENGRIFETMTKLDFPLANQPAFLLGNLDILISIYGNDDRFLLESYAAADTNTYRLRVHSIKLLIKMIDVNPAINIAIAKTLESQSALYSMRPLDCRATFISAGKTEITQSVYSSRIPRKLVLALVDSRAYNGILNLSPYNFESFSLREIIVEAGGSTFPYTPMRMQFKNDDDLSILRPYMDMQTNSCGGDQTNGITLERFRSGFTIFVIPLTSSMDENCSGFELIRSGQTSVRLLFNDPIPEPGVTLITIAENDELLSLNRDRIALSDASV